MAEDKVQESIAIEHMESHREDAKPTGSVIEEFLRSEKEMSTWQAIKTHKRILGYGELTSQSQLREKLI
jgi:SP family general alpha glucoside:H+ symporter-like MFS transporter